MTTWITQITDTGIALGELDMGDLSPMAAMELLVEQSDGSQADGLYRIERDEGVEYAKIKNRQISML